MKPIAFLLCITLALPLVACGGGGGNDQDNAGQETIPSTGNLDGILAFNNQGPVAAGGAGSIPLVGDDVFVQGGAGSVIREGLWSFDLSSIPAGATITSATLRLFVASQANDPDAMMVLARVDHVNFGTTFPTTSGQVNVIEFNFATIDDMNTTGERLIDATAQVQNDVDNTRGRSQYRVRGAIGSDNDDVAEFTVFTDADNTANAADRPFLVVTFTAP